MNAISLIYCFIIIIIIINIIIIILVYSAINCFLQSPRTGANPWS